MRLSKRLATIVTKPDATSSIRDIHWRGVHPDAFDIFDVEMGFNGAFNTKLESLMRRPNTGILGGQSDDQW